MAFAQLNLVTGGMVQCNPDTTNVGCQLLGRYISELSF